MLVVFIDELENVFSELVVVLLVRGVKEAFGIVVRSGSRAPVIQEYAEIFLLNGVVLHWLLRILNERRNLVKSSAHHAADYSLLEDVHCLFLVLALLDEVLRVGSDGLKTNELGDEHVVDSLDVVLDLRIGHFRLGMLLNLDGSEEHCLELGLKSLFSFISLHVFIQWQIVSFFHIDVDCGHQSVPRVFSFNLVAKRNPLMSIGHELDSLPGHMIRVESFKSDRCHGASINFLIFIQL